MSSIYTDEDNIEPDSPESILRCAIAVACCDGEFSYDEQDKVRGVYSDICREMTFAYNAPDVSEDFDDIAESVSEIVLGIEGMNERLKFVERLGESITDKDLREMTLIMSLRLAGADADLANAEYLGLKALANRWNISLSDVLGPYLA